MTVKKTPQELLEENISEFKLKGTKKGWFVSESTSSEDYNNALLEIGRLDKMGIKPEEENPKKIQINPYVPKHKETLQVAMVNFIDFIKKETLEKTLQAKENALVEFKNFFGAKKFVHEVTKKDLSDFKIFLSKEKDNTIRTINNKFVYIIQFFDFAISAGIYILENPARNQVKYTKKQKNKDTEKNRHLPFSLDEISKIFNFKNYIEYVDTPHDFWGMLLGLYTGARVNEICQLLVKDIDRENKTITFQVTTKEQSLKSSFSNRKIPVHEHLIELGFFDYVKDVDERGHFKLFPYLKKTKNNFGDRLSKSFARYLKKLNLKEERKSFHSFRSTFNNKMSDLKIPFDYRSVFLGQAIESVNLEHYTEKYSVKNLREICLKDVEFPVTVLRYKKGRFDNFL